MPHIAAKYSVEERDAMGVGMVDRGMSAHEVKAAAEAGLLERSDGTRLPPFDPPVSSIRAYARVVRKRRAGKASSEAAKLPPRDAVESVRIRLIRMIDLELATEERKRNGKRDLERIRQLGRAAREAAALPELNGPRPPSPGSKAAGSNPTSGGLGGAILKAHGPRAAFQRPRRRPIQQRRMGTQATHGAKRSTRPRTAARTTETGERSDAAERASRAEPSIALVWSRAPEQRV
jgi:hypothetical protein